jgi:hypothetical protein
MLVVLGGNGTRVLESGKPDHDSGEAGELFEDLQIDRL